MKIKLNNRLNLNKESITKLQESQMTHFRGGNADESWSCLATTCFHSCEKASCNAEELELA